MSKRFEELKSKAIPANPNKGWLNTVNELSESKPWKKDAVIIGLIILDALEALKMKSKDLANALNITPQAVSKIVRGKQNLTLGTIRKIEAVLSVSLISLKHQTNKPTYKARLTRIETNYSESINMFSGNINTLKQSTTTKKTKRIVTKLTICA